MTLRPMTMDDAVKMLEWKNYPETREFAIATKDEIKLDDHLKWLENNIKYFQIAEIKIQESNIPVSVGAVRIEEEGVISIWIDRAFRGHGFATQIIKEVSSSGFEAHIVEGNIYSMRAFIEAGYKPVNYFKSSTVPSYYKFVL